MALRRKSVSEDNPREQRLRDIRSVHEAHDPLVPIGVGVAWIRRDVEIDGEGEIGWDRG